MYVSDRSADSICDTALLFFVMKSEYMPSHLGGRDRTSPVFCVACLYILEVQPVQRARRAVECAMGVMLERCFGWAGSHRAASLVWLAEVQLRNERALYTQAR